MKFKVVEKVNGLLVKLDVTLDNGVMVRSGTARAQEGKKKLSKVRLVTPISKIATVTLTEERMRLPKVLVSLISGEEHEFSVIASKRKGLGTPEEFADTLTLLMGTYGQ